MQRPPTSQEEEPYRRKYRSEEPQQHVDKINPHRVLHSPNAAIALGILVNVHLTENAKHRRP